MVKIAPCKLGYAYSYAQYSARFTFATIYIKSFNDHIHSSIFSLLCCLHQCETPLFVNYFHLFYIHFTYILEDLCTHDICIVLFTLVPSNKTIILSQCHKYILQLKGQMQCNAMQCNAMQCNAMQCNAMQCNAMQCNAMQCMQCNNKIYVVAVQCKKCHIIQDNN